MVQMLNEKQILIQPRTSEKTEELYHGSPQRFGILMPRLDHGDPKVAPAIFATPIRAFGLAYLGKRWGDRDINQGMRGGPNARVILQEMRPGALEDISEHQTGYLHYVSKETFKALKGRRTGSVEVVSYEPVTPYKIEEIPDVLSVLKNTPKLELIKYNLKSRSTVVAIKRQVRRMLEMKTEDQIDYKKWRLEVATPEMRQMFEEEYEQQRIR
jgi:hypothetical protein